MPTVEVYEERAGHKVAVGTLTTAQPVSGSRVNETAIQELVLDGEVADQAFMTWLVQAALIVPGSPRKMTIWNVRDITPRDGKIVLTGVVFRPEGLCVACAGTGTFQASRHKATAKCPTCRGHGYVKGVWASDEPPTPAPASTPEPSKP